MKCLFLCEKKLWIEIFERLYKEHSESFSFIPEFYYAKYRVIAVENQHYFIDLDFEKMEKYKKENKTYNVMKNRNYNDEKFKELLKNNYDCIINACEPDDEGDEAFELTLKDFNLNIPTIRFKAQILDDENLLILLKNLSNKLEQYIQIFIVH